MTTGAGNQLSSLRARCASLESRLKEEVSAHACTTALLQEYIARAEGEEKLRLVLENMPVMMNAFDEDGVCVAWNFECERVLGFSADEMVGNPRALELLVPDAAYRERMAAEWANKGDHRDWEWEHTSKDGRKVIVAWSNISASFPVHGWATWGIGVNVTERRQALEQVRAARHELEDRVRERTTELETANERFRDVAEISGDWIWEVDADNRHIYSSERIAEILGIKPEEQIGTLLGSSERFLDRDTEGWKRHLEDMSARRPFTGYVFRCTGPDGKMRFLEISGKPVIDADGACQGYRGTGTDITERQRALGALKDSERRLLESQRLAKIGTFEHNLVSDEVVWTDEAFRLLGLEPGEVKPSFGAYMERLHPDDQDIVRQARAAIQRGEQPADSIRRVVWPDGSVHMLHSVADVERDHDENPVRVIRTLQDVTDRVQAEAAIRSSQSMFEAAFESSPGLAFIVGFADRRLLKVNDAWCKRLGYQREDVIGRSTDELGFWNDDEARKQRARDEVARTGSIHAFPTTLRSARGDIIHVEAFADALEYEGGKAIFTVAHDNTERKKYVDALWQAKENAEFANRTKSEFLANVSHELRTPLNAILGFSEMMSNGLAGPLTEKQSDYVADIFASGEHLLDLIGDVIDLSTIELGKMKLVLDQVDLHECVEECVTQVKNKIAELGLRLRVRDLTALPTISGDKRRIKQVVLNLLSNAMKFTDPEGEITVEGIVTGQHECAITIADTGVGMTQSMIEQALTAFKRGDDPMLRNMEGVGLGLSLVQSLVKAHGGGVAIESALGQGTRVTVTFPLGSCGGS